MKMVPFTKPLAGFGKHQGETVNIMHLTDMPLPTTGKLQEDTRIPIDKITFGNRAVTVVPYGRGAEYTNLMEQLGKFDIGSWIQKKLTQQMDRVMDTAAAAAFQNTDVKICFIPTSLTGGTFDVDGTPSTVALANLTAEHMGILADYMAGDVHIPPYEGDDFIFCACRKALRGLKQDRLWQQVAMYLNKGDLFFRGEVGKIENIRCVQVDREEAISNTAGTSTVLGNGVVFGDEAVVRVEAQAPELYADPNYQSDFGRTKAVAWHGILAFASVWTTASDKEAKIIRVTSA